MPWKSYPKTERLLLLLTGLSTIVNADKISAPKKWVLYWKRVRTNISLQSGGAYADMYHLQSDANLDA